MADEKDKDSRTEPASPKRRNEARQRGMAVRSQDLSTAISIAAALAILGIFGTNIFAALKVYLQDAILAEYPSELTTNSAMALIMSAIGRLFPVVGAFAAACVAVAAFANYYQVGFEFTPQAIAWDISRINPFKGFGSLFRIRTLIRVGASTIKTAIVVTASYLPVKSQLPQIALLDRADLSTILSFMGALLSKAAIGVCIALILLGIADYYYERWQYERDLKMTKEEVKEETKQSEGDPLVRSHIKRKRREMAYRRMMDAVPKATVVVTNPTHYAVALRYEMDEDLAPKIVAKGKDLVALKIREIAKEHGVPIIENPPLAQSLYRGSEVGDDIPAALYRAVAELLSYVYRLRGKVS